MVIFPTGSPESLALPCEANDFLAAIDLRRTFIRHERRIELAGEGLRYFDILRWKTGEQVLNGPIYTIDASAGPLANSEERGRVHVVRFDRVWGSKVRLSVEAFDAPPGIAEFGVYDERR